MAAFASSVTMAVVGSIAGVDGEGEVVGGGWEGPQVAVTCRPVEGVTCTPDLGEGIGLAREAAGDRAVDVRGATLARGLEPSSVDHIPLATQPRDRVVH